MSLDPLGSGFVLIASEGNLDTIIIGVLISRDIYIYTFIKLYTVNLLFSEFITAKWFS